MIEIAVLAFDNCQASAVASMVEVFTVANIQWRLRQREASDLFRCRILSADSGAVRCLGGVTIATEGDLDDALSADVIFLPGIRTDDSAAMHRFIAAFTRAHGAFFREQHRRGAHLCASCSGVFLLAEAGLLAGRTATTSWWLTKLFQQRYPDVSLRPDRLVTSDQRIHCAGAFTACLNLGLSVVERFAGPDLALSCARVMLVDANRTSQLPYATLQDEIKHNDRLVADAQHWLRSHLDQAVTVAALAGAIGATPRTLVRRFQAAIGTPPLKYLQRLRIEQAKRLLATSDQSIELVAEAVGYGDVAGFRRIFERETSLTPGQYRSRFRKPPRAKDDPLPVAQATGP